MLKLVPLLLVTTLLYGCVTRPPPKPEPVLKVDAFCPSWKDAAKGRKDKLAGELIEAPKEAVWPDVLVADQSLKDQLVAVGCKPL